MGSSPRVRGKPHRSQPLIPEQRLIPACAGKTADPNSVAPDAPAHPRVCGENAPLTDAQSLFAGSSPRVRGKPPGRSPAYPGPGLIPACAGKTRSCGLRGSCCWAHPRVCGENAVPPLGAATCMGSSPRVRGKQQDQGQKKLPPRLIPACAGKTFKPRAAVIRSRAHPRVCGENIGTTYGGYGQSGSSPRVRGKQALLDIIAPPRRLIPACAGKTQGEGSAAKVHAGSSPRVRGKREWMRAYMNIVGLIPACAGKTTVRGAVQRFRRAHPRVCGENSTVVIALFIGRGSSPRVRGKRAVECAGHVIAGLIPACAGKTARFFPCEPGDWAHPRVCGENRGSENRCARTLGSSPRVRGKLEYAK